MSVKLADATAALQSIAPLEYAEEWDNVGLLIEPYDERWASVYSSPWNDPKIDGCGRRPVRRIMLTIDLTEPVLEEAIEAKVDLMVAYHPPIFKPIHGLGSSNTRSRVLMRAIAAKIALYSPHTALDAARGGVSDWLASGLGEAQSCDSLAGGRELPHDQSRCKLVVFIPKSHVDQLRGALAERCRIGMIGDYTHCSFNIEGVGTFLGNERSNPTIGQSGRLEQVGEIRLEMICYRSQLNEIAKVISETHPYEEPAWEVYPLVEAPHIAPGAARRVMLKQSVTIKTLIDRVKRHLGLKHVRVASPASHPLTHRINHIAVCPGAGGSVFDGDWGPQVYLTGEMRHHDVLAKVEQGATVILCDHTHTERGYLPVLKKKLHAKLGKGVKIDIAKSDAEPLRIV